MIGRCIFHLYALDIINEINKAIIKASYIATEIGPKFNRTSPGIINLDARVIRNPTWILRKIARQTMRI